MISKGSLLVVCLLTSVACATTNGTEVTAGNNQIVMPHYSVTVPPNEGWHLHRPGGFQELAILTKEQSSTPLGAVVFEMKFMRNAVLDPSMRTQKAKQIADDFRKIEKRIMIEQGVNRGLYKLSDVKMGEERVGGKRFYFMDYRTHSSVTRQWASLYLFFPKGQGNDAFIVAHYSETMPVDVVLFNYSKSNFVDVLRTLRVR
jgi:hypothetical protein